MISANQQPITERKIVSPGNFKNIYEAEGYDESLLKDPERLKLRKLETRRIPEESLLDISKILLKAGTDILPAQTDVFNIGSDEKTWNKGYFNDLFLRGENILDIVNSMVVTAITGITVGDTATIDLTLSGTTITGIVRVDSINDTHIDWGTGANQVSLDDVPDGTSYERVAANQLSSGIYIDATTAVKGIASFNSNHFSVTSGAVSVVTDGIDDTLIDWGAGANQVDISDIPTLNIGTPTISTVADWFNLGSAGEVSGGIISATGTQIAVTGGYAAIKTSTTSADPVRFTNFSALALTTVTDARVTWVTLDYNGGSPTITLIEGTTNAEPAAMNYNSVFPLGYVVREGAVVHVTNNPRKVIDATGMLIRRFHQTLPFSRDELVGGLILGETGTRNITLSAGYLWDRQNRFQIAAFDSSGASRFDAYYRDGAGGFTKVATQSQWDNINYDNNAGSLTALTNNNKYANLWWYLEADGDIVMIYGRNEYNTAAQAALGPVPSTLPLRVLIDGKLIARTTFQKNGATFTAIDTVFSNTFSSSAVTTHNNLSGLQGGTTNEYYHLTSADYTELTSWLDDVTLASNGDTTVPILTATTGIVPDANDGAYLGTTALGFSDLFLAAQGVINWANGEATITETSADVVTVGGADLKVTSPGNVANSVVTTDGTQTLTAKTLTSPVLNTGVSGTAVDTDPVLTANSDTLLASQKAIKAYVDSSSALGGGTSWVQNEVPSGAVNGVNTAFDTASNYVAGTIQVYRDGQRMKGAGNDYTETDANTITFTTAPAAGSLLLVDYQQNTSETGNADTLDGFHAASFVKIKTVSNTTNPGQVRGYTTTATSGGTTSLSNTSTSAQVFTGTSNEVVRLPLVSTIEVGHTYKIINNSTGAVTVATAAPDIIFILAPSTSGDFTCVSVSDTTIAGWIYTVYSITPSSGASLSITGTSASANFGVWGTPSWTPTLTGIALVSGTLTARYVQVGKIVKFKLTIVFAADTTISGDLIFTLPVTAYGGQVAREPMGNAILYDSGTASYAGVVVADITSPTTKGILRVMSPATYIGFATLSSSVPFGWGVNDAIYLQGSYETT